MMNPYKVIGVLMLLVLAVGFLWVILSMEGGWISLLVAIGVCAWTAGALWFMSRD